MNKYNNKFYDNQKGGSFRSAKIILPLIINSIKPKSVLDVGCGLGTWLKVAMDCGITDIAGLDGEYIEINRLVIPKKYFFPTDLTKSQNLKRRFDLVISLEVAEHLPKRYSRRFVSTLTRHSDYILFSAAIPDQGGTNHINEQWQSYWEKIFNDEGYDAIDCIRPVVWKNKSVEWWYSQNAVLYVNRNKIKSDLLRNLKSNISTGYLDIVHPSRYLLTSRPKSIFQTIKDAFTCLLEKW
ncbi:MAG: hypothetical protein UU64_C0009G0009 [candidate division WWE3 bacterium GW2011_GWF2_41_45]|uniref:Methyltransferase domain-containing protein n=1 Tax=candidate division WWE3 bacterium GW2011_GWC2_41_23 TaxID=1619123 RepID=A0A0G0YPI4_UNCKA|nr:MAG: hypothetical protein UU55_C0016G0009 [candidate division WWE3 bacterium GW2011_GWC2_41_23]KKS10107.1 MAG: hypothetical protein UU64_C0009G0009 [candidate division WWE3 bacterium GW2011_GWF2_41_45]